MIIIRKQRKTVHRSEQNLNIRQTGCQSDESKKSKCMFSYIYMKVKLKTIGYVVIEHGNSKISLSHTKFFWLFTFFLQISYKKSKHFVPSPLRSLLEHPVQKDLSNKNNSYKPYFKYNFNFWRIFWLELSIWVMPSPRNILLVLIVPKLCRSCEGYIYVHFLACTKKQKLIYTNLSQFLRAPPVQIPFLLRHWDHCTSIIW